MAENYWPETTNLLIVLKHIRTHNWRGHKNGRLKLGFHRTCDRCATSLRFKQEISFKKLFGCISIVEFVILPIRIALCYTGSDMGKYNGYCYNANIIVSVS